MLPPHHLPHSAVWVASAGVGREGQQAKRIWVGEKKGELRSPLQASQQVWTVLQLVPV